MRIGILGAGNVGGALGSTWAKKGHSIRYGVREPGKESVTELLRSIGGGAEAGTPAEAAAFGEVIVLSTPWSSAKSAIESAGDLEGKILFDTTNPLKRDLSGLDVGDAGSGGQQVAAWAKGARVVKIFNTTGAENMANPRYGDQDATMLYCGDDEAAKSVARQLATDLGFDPLDAGPLKAAAHLEHFALLWIYLAIARKEGRGIAWKLVRR